MSTFIGSREWREEMADYANLGPDRLEYREPEAGEVVCEECERGIREWCNGDQEGREVCCECNGSGCVTAPDLGLHPVFVQALAPFMPKVAA